jgi:hypothetical protein
VLAGSLDQGGNVIERARDIDENKGAYVAGAVLQGLSYLPLAPLLVYLYRVTAYRRPETPPWSRPLAVFGAVAIGLAAVASSINQLGAIEDVVADLPLSVPAAEDRLSESQTEGVGLVFVVLGYAARIALAFALIAISNAARKAGTLSSFLGITGIIVGVFLVLPFFGPLPIVQWFWLGALAVLFLDRWPTGRGPAWESGEADPWPTAAELRARAAAERDEVVEEEYEERDEEPAEAPAGTAHPKSKKRKRKRRR